MSHYSAKFYEELISEQNQLMEKLNNDIDPKVNNNALIIVSNLIRGIYKYNQYVKSKLQTLDDLQDKEDGKKKKV